MTTFLSQSIDAQTTLEFETDVEDLTSSLISTELPDVTITFTMSSGTLFNVDGKTDSEVQQTKLYLAQVSLGDHF